MTTTWWKGASHQHYTIEKKCEEPRSFSEVVAMEPHDLGASSLDVTVHESLVETPNVRMIGPQGANSGDSASTFNSGGLFNKAMLVGRNIDDNSRVVVAGFHSQDPGALAWHDKAS